MGRLTADPELRQTQSGISSCRFTVAVNRRYKNESTGEYDADFITCVAWRQTAEFVSKYFSKGKMIALEGSLRTGKYQDKNPAARTKTAAIPDRLRSRPLLHRRSLIRLRKQAFRLNSRNCYLIATYHSDDEAVIMWRIRS